MTKTEITKQACGVIEELLRAAGWGGMTTATEPEIKSAISDAYDFLSEHDGTLEEADDGLDKVCSRLIEWLLNEGKVDVLSLTEKEWRKYRGIGRKRAEKLMRFAEDTRASLEDG